jgi:hypothetical protein
MYKMKITAAAVGVIILAGSGWFYKRADGSEAPIYRTATIQRGSVNPTVSATGTLSAVKTIQVGTQVSGQVAAIYVDYNQHVRKGQLLATIDAAYAITRRISALGTIGYEEIRFSGLPPTRISDVVWATGVRLTPSPDTIITATYGHQNGFTAPNVSLSWNLTELTTLTASAARIQFFIVRISTFPL